MNIAGIKAVDWIFYLGLAVTLESAIGNGTLVLTNAIPSAWIPTVQAWCGILAFVGTALMTGLSRMTGSAPPSVPPIVNKIAVVVLALALGTVIAAQFVAPAAAETKKPVLTGNIVNDLASLKSSNDPAGALMNKLSAVNAETVAGVIAALQEADADAGALVNTATGDVRDPISHACFPAQIKFLQSLPNAQPITSPAPYNLIVLFQRKRDFVAQIQAGLPAYLKLGCSAMIGQEIAIFVQTLGLIGLNVAAGDLVPLLPAIAIPSLPVIAAGLHP